MVLVLSDQQLFVFVGRDKRGVSFVFVGSWILATPQLDECCLGKLFHFARFGIATFEHFRLPRSWVNNLRRYASIGSRTLPITACCNHLAEGFWVGTEELVFNYQSTVVVVWDQLEGLSDDEKALADHGKIDQIPVFDGGHGRRANTWVNSDYDHGSPP